MQDIKQTRVAEIKHRLVERADADQARQLQRFFKTGPGEYAEGDRFLGIRVPVLRTLAREYPDLSVDEMDILLQSDVHECRFLALVLMVNAYRRGNETDRQSLYEAYCSHTAFINNWDLVDTSAEPIVGAHLLHRSRTPLHRWARSHHLWERRIAIMATFHFIRNGEFEETLALAETLLEDSHDLIHKAVGWMLREVGNRDRPLEEAFLDRHAGSMPRTMLRYAIEKFPERERKFWMTRRG